RCPSTACRFGYQTDVWPATHAVRCPRCGQGQVWNSAAIREGKISDCPLCGCGELYVRKDFPQRVGLLLVIAVGIAAWWLVARGELLGSLGVLAALVLVDLLIYSLVAKITVCYRCRAEFRDLSVNPEHTGFDLATAEKYR